MHARERRSEPLMPKRLVLALAVISLAIAACNGGSTSPSPSVSPGSPSPNPSITTAKLEVTIAGTPAPKIPVEISTPANPTSPRPGTPFLTQNTNYKGKTAFHDLKPSKTYCWVALIAPSFRSSECAGWAVWQTSIIILGN
jgi:hypothetical protein